MNKNILYIFLLLFVNAATYSQEVEEEYPSLFVRHPDSTLSTLEEKYIAQNDTTGLMYVYGGYLITGNFGQESVIRSLFFFLSNIDSIQRLPLKDQYRLRLAILVYHWGSSKETTTQKVEEIEEIMAVAGKNKWYEIVVEGFQIKYYLLAGKNYMYDYPKEIADFYNQHEKFLPENTFTTININTLMGRYSSQQKDYKTAMFCFEKALEISKKIDAENFQYIIQLFIIQNLRLNGNTQKAIAEASNILTYLGDILPEKITIGDLDMLRWAHEELAKSYDQQQQYKLANIHWGLYDETIKRIARRGNATLDNDVSLLERLEEEFIKKRKQQQLQQNLLAQSKRNNRLLSYLMIAALAFVVASVIGVVVWYRQSRMRLKKENELNIIAKQEEEREQISRELHDHVGSTLIAIKNTLPKENTKIQHLLSEVYSVIRATSHSLNSSAIAEVGLTETCQDFIAMIDPEKKIVFNSYGEVTKIELIKLQTVFRIIQELLNNALKYSSADEIQLSIYYSKIKLLIHVEDSGVGFNQLNVSRGNGIMNIKHRVSLLNGDLEIDSKPGVGTSTWVVIPINQKSLQ